MTAEPKAVRGGGADDYWALARQPLNCLIFLMPLLVLYEAGVLWVGGRDSESLRNGADHWMRGWLSQLGAPQPYLLPVFVVGGLLVWQVIGKYSWRVSLDAMLGMLAESLLFAFCLVVIGQIQDLAFRHCQGDYACQPDEREGHRAPTAALPRQRGRNGELPGLPQRSTALHAAAIDSGTLPRVIRFVGAGVYEEVLFRLCLLPACFAAFRLLFLPGRPAAVLAVLCTSLAFSIAHHIGPSPDPFTPFIFMFRTIAGLFFAILFVLRGFGITAGCHAAYDVLVGVVA